MIWISRRYPLVAAIIAAGIAVLATSAQARLYTVTLTNGAAFETRYPPVVFDDEPEATYLLTDRGNWISVQTSEVADVEAREEDSPYGQRLDSKPRFLGWMWVEETPPDDETKPRYELPERSLGNDSFERFLGPRAVEPGDVGGGIPLDDFYDDFYPFGRPYDAPDFFLGDHLVPPVAPDAVE